MQWGRTHSGCYFCFFQKKIEWVRLLEKYPEDFDRAQAYEKEGAEPGETFTWIQDMPLRELRKPENVTGIKREWAVRVERSRNERKSRTLVQVFAGSVDECEPTACLICQL
jgi:hypothetical protein